ncbi:MAG: GNAT family N-acetyltransferase [Candidatus Korobacteraceae bacterium]
MVTTPNFNLRYATDSDVEAIVSLVNRAFAIESFFKTGDRIDEAQIREMMQHGPFLLLAENDTLIACVYVERRGDRVYIGVLAVDPPKQKLGIGARMMREAEDFGRRAGCKFADIRVVNVRPELPLIYGKLGYVESGVESAAVIQTATMPVHFVTMSKPL